MKKISLMKFVCDIFNRLPFRIFFYIDFKLIYLNIIFLLIKLLKF